MSTCLPAYPIYPDDYDGPIPLLSRPPPPSSLLRDGKLLVYTGRESCSLTRNRWFFAVPAGDPEPWARVKLGSLLKMGLFLMGGALLCLQLWFWTTGVHDRPPSSSADAPSCHQYGFIFAPVRLDSAVLITFNIGVHFIMLVVGTWVFACWVGLFDECRWYRHRKKEKWR